jgi:hypothetical protein
MRRIDMHQIIPKVLWFKPVAGNIPYDLKEKFFRLFGLFGIINHQKRIKLILLPQIYLI